MDINARIDWQAGMEITAKTFQELDKSIVTRQQMVTRVNHLGVLGILPNTRLSCKCIFVKNKLEIERLVCMALLPSGKLIDIDQPVEVVVPMLYGEEYFLAAAFGTTYTEFNKEGVPFSKPTYEFSIRPLIEFEHSDLFPLLKFSVSDGLFSIDEAYIPPFLLLESEKRFLEHIQQISEGLLRIAEHPNLEFAEGKRAFLHYYSLLTDYEPVNSVHDFLQLTREIAQAIHYYVVKPNTENPIQMEVCSRYDVQAWLVWFYGYINAALSILDKVVLEDNTVDFDALKAQIKAELYQQLHPELRLEMYERVKQELKDELSESLRSNLLKYVDEKLKVELHDTLHAELSTDLSDRLYHTLYDALYNALYVPMEEEEDEFTPII